MKRLAGLVTIAGIAACSNPTVPIADRLSGSWLWVESWGGITGQVRTPSSTGETMSLRFFEPDRIELSRNGSLAGKTTYLIDHFTGSMVISYDEPIFGFSSQSIRFDGEETLILTDPCCDGFTYRFRRSS
ncbi:MAG: hypothetical protein ABGY10_00425 [bacterium]|nr:hypothetical protein [Gemmatimonadota bacterium]HIL90388.1 hypothetical protein [Gemmatimonadota bacterium]